MISNSGELSCPSRKQTEDTAHNLAQTPPETTITAFFKLSQQDVFAKSLMYGEVPPDYTMTKQKPWIRQKQGKTVQGHEVKESDAIGCVYTVHSNNKECFYLRLFLHTVKEPTSFEDLQRFQGRVSTTYQETCRLYGLLKDDEHWKKTLEEAVAS